MVIFKAQIVTSRSKIAHIVCFFPSLLGDHTVTDEHLNLVRQNLGSKWKSCARNLGITDVELDNIEHDYERDGLAEKVYQMLMRWKMKEGLAGCTVGKLCHSLDGFVKADLLVQLLNMSKHATCS